MADPRNSPSRVLLIKPSAIGDVVHTLPILTMLRRCWPAAHLAWLVTPACAGLLEGHPHLDEVILFERRKLGRMWRSPRALIGLLDLGRSLRRRNFDLVLDFQGLFRSGSLARWTGAPRRIGFANAREMAPMFYTHRVRTGDAEQHAISRYIQLAQAAGCQSNKVEFHFVTTHADRSHVAGLVPAGPYAVLLPGTNWRTKRWPIEKFAALVDPLRERFGLSTVVAGGPDAAPLARQVSGAADLAGQTSLPQLVALLERAELVIANDSGPMHIAAALGKPLVTPYGPTSHIRTGPYDRLDSVIRLDIPCSPCFSRKCSHHSCMRWLEVEPVLRMAHEQMRVPHPKGVVHILGDPVQGEAVTQRVVLPLSAAPVPG